MQRKCLFFLKPPRPAAPLVLTGLTLFILSVLSILSGCASPPRKEIFVEGGPTTEAIYRGTGGSQGDSSHTFARSDGELAPYTRDQDNELANHITELRNRRLNLYVFPHLSRDGSPIPGYTTSFYLYDHARVFALPGEAAAEGGP